MINLLGINFLKNIFVNIKKNLNIKKLILITNFILKKYCYTINHKRLGLNYIYFTMLTGLTGAILATIIRVEMAYPGSPFLAGDSLRYLQIMTGHALIMIFFVVVPVIFGGFANFLIPYHVGSKDVAFPRLNSFGFWMQPCGYLLVAKVGFLKQQYWHYYDNIGVTEYINSDLPSYSAKKSIITQFFDANDYYMFSDNMWSFFKFFYNNKIKKKYITKTTNASMTVSGWTFITPFSSNTRYTSIGMQDILIIGVIYVGLSSTISIINLLVTRRVLSMFGIKNRKVLLPFISIAIFLMLRALALITPVLGSAMIMLILDRHWHTAFFDYTYGGDAILFQHLFWFFGHPEVYVLIVPGFGIINQILPVLSMRRVAAKHHMMWAIYVMTYMGFIVWGHHMYLIGLDHRSRSLYSTITIMISLPATIKVVNWVLTLTNATIIVDLLLLFSIVFIFFFLVAGITGMWLSHVSLNISMHDTFYVVAHFHIMLSGAAVSSIFICIYYYYSIFFNVTYSRLGAHLHLIYYFFGQWMTFLPMFWLGFSGMPRRVHDYPSIFIGWHSMASVGHLVTIIGIVFFYTLFLESLWLKKTPNLELFGVPRLNKRLSYYIFKILYTYKRIKLFSFLPKKNVYKLLNLYIVDIEKNY